MTFYPNPLSSLPDPAPFAACPSREFDLTSLEPIAYFRRPREREFLPSFVDPIEPSYRPFEQARLPGHRGYLDGVSISIWDEIQYPGLSSRVDRFNGLPISSYDRSADPALSTFLNQRQTPCGIAGCLGSPDFTAPRTSPLF